ncbi:MAG: OsmC family protein [Armatimonadota bacterium]|nr:OsmC family protein [Armatimonadota bacterium]MDR7452524.1 OsmC family protein [Armatimonadota bacterium]MDR7467751.1 OsmC family protein [Armatimonadota bacterium]MDR7494951.1 OsmC family protein [Armatimonadota bacterium]MDR7499784.1 OsmC family protein [Armatimonadota bacterium]
MKVSVEWAPPLRFIGTSAHSGAQLMIEDRREGVTPAGPSPMETTLMALASCSAVDVVEILQKMRGEITGLRVEADAERAPDPPRVFTKVRLRYRVSGRGLSRQQVERAVALSVDKYCSVAGMVKRTAELSYDVVLDET